MIEFGIVYQCQMDRIEPDGLVMKIVGEEQEFLVQPRLEKPFVKGKEYPVFSLKRMNDGRFLGSLKIPDVQLNEVQYFTVSRMINAGLYMDWGMEEMPLFVPKSMMAGLLKEGMMAPVRLIQDEKSGQLIGDMQWKRQLLPADEDFFRSQEVEIMVMEPSELGYLVLVNQHYSGMVYANQIFKPLRLGETRVAFVNKVREDGKLDILLQRPGYGEVKDASTDLLEQLKKAGGRLLIGDKTPPEMIASQLNMSKKVFKKVAGALYKSGKVGISDMAIWLMEDEGD